MMKVKILLSSGLIAMGFLFPSHADAQSFADKVGAVAAHLFTTTVWNARGPTMADAQAKAWDMTILNKSKHSTNGVSTSFQYQSVNTYDAIRLVFDTPNGQTLKSQQTMSVWTLTIDAQDTSGKTDEELASLVTSKAVDYLNAFVNRSFSYDGLYDGIKVFRLSVNLGNETGDWRDNLWAIVNGSNIGYSCVKKQAQPSACRHTSASGDNKRWFSVVTSGSKTLQGKKVILPAQVTLKPEALEVSPGILTVFVRLPEGYPVSGITSATCDGAAPERMPARARPGMPNEDGMEMIIKFRRKDIEEALAQIGENIDVDFVVRGTWQDEAGNFYLFQGADSITKIVGAKEKEKKK